MNREQELLQKIRNRNLSVKNHNSPLTTNHETEENSKSALHTELNIPKQASEDVKNTLNQKF